ncbi:MAG: tRNA (guanosine(46)-N7)-methyltransferase TrmB [Flavobacteriales bacterium]|nr:tRNA (guanosine(46)-N7)-methyltransferase TrmB [Flavobacteriales bacterium]NNK81463.1 tRNA (guanosine(46)-N7)-methyltransferase TrmB [Flavobacteriales bacterium]
MGKDKLRKFAEVSEMDHVLEPSHDEMLHGSERLRGHWHREIFRNENPITLELACGKGEYTIALAERYKERNHIGVDIKGNRIWRGAKTSKETGMNNVAFLRTHIESIDSFFAKNEVDEIWITFPDPQKKSRREKKRLTHPLFLNRYRNILRPGGTVNLKTDSSTLYDYTMDVILEQSLKVHHQCIDIYNLGRIKFPDDLNELMETKTHYEQMWLDEGKQIKFISFEL